MKTKILLFTVIWICLTSANLFGQKTYVNSEWVQQTPAVGDGIYHSSSIVVSNKLVVTNKVLNDMGNTDIATIKYGNNGDTLWMVTYNGSANLDDYGITLASTVSGDIVVAGASQNSGTGYDYTILRYNGSTGTLLWNYSWNGVADDMDIPTDILIDGSDNVYVTGGSKTASGLSDYATIKLSASGVFQWLNTYDYASLHDGASNIELNGGNIIVSGASAATVGDWDIATLKLNPTSGSIVNSYRTDGGATIVDVHGMTTDASNNIYLTGYAEIGGDKNIQTLKLDSDLNLLWTANYIGTMDDIGNDIGIDGLGNVYITGTTQYAADKYKAITLKYNSVGGEIWRREHGNVNSSKGAVAKKIHVLPTGDMFITGTLLGTDDNGSYFFNKYNTNGTFMCSSSYQSDGIDNSAYDISVDGNNVFITGLSNNMVSQQTTVVKFSLNERNLTAVTIGGANSHVNDEIVIRFNRDYLITSAVDDENKSYGTLDEFIIPIAISALSATVSTIDWSKVTTYKVYQGLKTTDTLSIARNGIEVEVDTYWATFVVQVKDKDEVSIAQNLDTAMFPYIRYAHINGLYQLDSDDPLFPSQHSLTSATYPDGNININSAWDLESGKDFIRVGVYDTGLRYSHEDFGGADATDPINGKVRGGKDYHTGGTLESIENNGDYNGHGTKVAGIIGAYRNNDHGVAGIAGGNYPYEPGDDPVLLSGENKGASLYGFRIAVSTSELIPESDIAAALVEGAASISDDYGYALHVLNCSFGKNFGVSEDSWNAMFDAQEFVFRNGAVMVASKGNSDFEIQRYPSYSLKDYWTMAIGGSTFDGGRHEDSNYGNDVDVIAPYESSMIQSTYSTSDDTYGSFAGTSASAPHVSGVAALILSHHNVEGPSAANLTADDVEYLIEEYAIDQYVGEAEIWWDKYTGHGLLDAGTILEYINNNQYVIRHYYASFLLDLDEHIHEIEPITIFFEDEDHEAGEYSGDKYWIEYDNPHVMNPGDVRLGIWALQSYTNTCVFHPWYTDRSKLEEEMIVNYMNDTEARLWGETIHFTSDPDGNPVDFWYPIAPGEEVRLGYGLHIRTDYLAIEEEEEEVTSVISTYPNPTESIVTLSFTLDQDSDVSGEIIDLNGKVVQKIAPENYSIGRQRIKFDLTNLAEGMYLVHLNFNNEDHYERVIKN